MNSKQHVSGLDLAYGPLGCTICLISSSFLLFPHECVSHTCYVKVWMAPCYPGELLGRNCIVSPYMLSSRKKNASLIHLQLLYLCIFS